MLLNPNDWKFLTLSFELPKLYCITKRLDTFYEHCYSTVSAINTHMVYIRRRLATWEDHTSCWHLGGPETRVPWPRVAVLINRLASAVTYSVTSQQKATNSWVKYSTDGHHLFPVFISSLLSRILPISLGNRHKFILSCTPWVGISCWNDFPLCI